MPFPKWWLAHPLLSWNLLYFQVSGLIPCCDFEISGLLIELLSLYPTAPSCPFPSLLSNLDSVTGHYNRCLINIFNPLSSFIIYTWQNSDLGWTQAFAISELAPKHLGFATLSRVAVLPQPEMGLLPHSPSGHFMTCSIPQTSHPFLHFSQLVSSWWPYPVGEEEAIRWNHLCLPSIVVQPFLCLRPFSFAPARPAPAISVPSLPLSLPHFLPLYWLLGASSNASLDPVIFSNCSVSPLLIIVKLLKRAIFCF